MVAPPGGVCSDACSDDGFWDFDAPSVSVASGHPPLDRASNIGCVVGLVDCDPRVRFAAQSSADSASTESGHAGRVASEDAAPSESEDEWEGGVDGVPVQLEDEDDWDAAGVSAVRLEDEEYWGTGDAEPAFAAHAHGVLLEKSDIGADAYRDRHGLRMPGEDSEEEWAEAIHQEALRSLAGEDVARRRTGPGIRRETELIQMQVAKQSDPSAPVDDLEEADHSRSEDGEALALNVCVRCGTEVVRSLDFAAELGVRFCCEMAGRWCDELDDDDARPAYVHCCVACGESCVLGIDLTSHGIEFKCSIAGCECDELSGVVAGVDAEESEEEGDVPVQVCTMCGAGYAVALDLVGLGLEFQCSLLGRTCWASAGIANRRWEAEPASEKGSADAKAIVLSMVEQQRLLAKFGHGYRSKRSWYQPKLERAEVVRLLELNGRAPQERYRQSEIVSTKGERFINTTKKAPQGPGTELAGILGSSSRGRQGLGLNKMTKAEAERVKCSNKERGHLKKKVAHAKTEREIIQFETKQTHHQLVHATVHASSVITFRS